MPGARASAPSGGRTCGRWVAAWVGPGGARSVRAMLLPRLPLVLAVAMSVLAAAPAHAAGAGAITYVKDDNLWVMAADGGQRHQVTSDGSAGFAAWRSPSLAPDGTLWASNRNDIVQLTQAGQILRRIDPPAHSDSTGSPIDGVPLWVDVSPDGARVAYGYAHVTCPAGASCGARSVVGITDATGPTPASTYGTELNMREPSWYGDGELVVFGGAGQQVNTDTPSSAFAHWLDHLDIWPNASPADLQDGAVSPDRRRLAVMRTDGDDRKVLTFELSGEPGAGLPAPACAAGPVATSDADPTWSPDSTSIAVATPLGIEIGDFSVRGEAGCGAATWKTVAPAGSHSPDWAPAAFDPAPKPVTPPDTSKPGTDPVTTPRPRPATPRVTKGKVMRSGRTVRATLTCEAACRYTATFKQGRRAVATRKGTAKAGRAVTVRVTLSAKALKALGGRKLTLQVTAAAA